MQWLHLLLWYSRDVLILVLYYAVASTTADPHINLLQQLQPPATAAHNRVHKWLPDVIK